MCVAESEKTNFKHIGKSYYYVELDCAVLEPEKKDKWTQLQGKSHGVVQQATDKDDPTFKLVKDFVDRHIIN